MATKKPATRKPTGTRAPKGGRSAAASAPTPAKRKAAATEAAARAIRFNANKSGEHGIAAPREGVHGAIFARGQRGQRGQQREREDRGEEPARAHASLAPPTWRERSS